MRGKPGTVATLLAEDRAAFLPLPARPFEARRVTEAAADSLSLVRFDTNAYSVPTRYAHRTLTVVGDGGRGADRVRGPAGGPAPAVLGPGAVPIFDPIHYLALLERKPGGFDFARPLEEWELPGVLRRAPPAAGSGRPETGTGRGRSSGCCGCWRRTPWRS